MSTLTIDYDYDYDQEQEQVAAITGDTEPIPDAWLFEADLRVECVGERLSVGELGPFRSESECRKAADAAVGARLDTLRCDGRFTEYRPDTQLLARNLEIVGARMTRSDNDGPDPNWSIEV